MSDQPTLTCFPASSVSVWPPNVQGSKPLPARKSTNRAANSSSCAGQTSQTSEMSAGSPTGSVGGSTLSPAAIRARRIHAREAMARASMPTSPDTSLPWSQDFRLGGWSARMFLHQLCSISRQPWTHLDTEFALSELTPLRLRLKAGKGISLSEVIRSPEKRSRENSVRSASMVRGLMRRALARGRSLRVLLRTERDTIPVIVTFSNPENSASWKVKSAKPLPDSLRDGLLDFLRRHAPACSEIASSRPSPTKSSKPSAR